MSPLFDKSKLENVVVDVNNCQAESHSDGRECPLDRGAICCYEGSRNSTAMLDPYWIGGAQKHVKRTPLSAIVLLKRDTIAPKASKPSVDQALRMIEEGGYSMSHGRWFSVPFYNPYLLVQDGDRIEILRRQWQRLLKSAPLIVINTEIMGKEEAKEVIWKEIYK